MIFYSLLNTSIGFFILAGSKAGLSYSAFGDDKNSLIEALHNYFQGYDLQAVPITAAELIAVWAQRIELYFQGRSPWPVLPVAMHGSSFQKSVWQKLMMIPAGQTLSYQEIAQSLDKPGAAIAIGQACAKNSLAVIIPCHRVLPKSGHYGQYRWDAYRKKALLDIEKRNIADQAAQDAHIMQSA